MCREDCQLISACSERHLYQISQHSLNFGMPAYTAIVYTGLTVSEHHASDGRYQLSTGSKSQRRRRAASPGLICATYHEASNEARQFALSNLTNATQMRDMQH